MDYLRVRDMVFDNKKHYKAFYTGPDGKTNLVWSKFFGVINVDHSQGDFTGVDDGAYNSDRKGFEV